MPPDSAAANVILKEEVCLRGAGDSHGTAVVSAIDRPGMVARYRATRRRCGDLTVDAEVVNEAVRVVLAVAFRARVEPRRPLPGDALLRGRECNASRATRVSLRDTSER